MGAAANAAMPAQGWVDFQAVSSAALNSLDIIIPRLLPGGHRSANEWIARNPTRADGKPGSFKVNLATGLWSDFATGDTGGDAIDLLVYLEGKTKLEAAREIGAMLNVRLADSRSALANNLRTIQPRKPSHVAATPERSRAAPETFPPRTPPDQDGKPRFVIAGDEGPRIRNDEKRRHAYCQGNIPIRIKIIRSDSEAFNVFRVAGADGVTGWQYRKPECFETVPYFAALDPFATDQPIYWPEGEKDVDTLAKVGLPAFTFGGTGDGLPEGCAAYLAGRAVVIPADNDSAGRKHAEEKAAACHGIAASVRVIHFQDTPDKGDVSDWMAAGHTAAELADRADATAPWCKVADQPSAQGEQESGQPVAAERSHVPASETDAGTEQETNKAPTDSRFNLPFGYRFKENGLYCRDHGDEEKPDVYLASPFDIVAETRDGDGASWGLLLHWVDHDDRDHRLALPRSMLAGDGSEARRLLLDGGMFIAPSQKARGLFNSFLLQVRSPTRARATQRIGWHGAAFVLPDDCFGGQSDLHLLQTATAHEHSFRQAGTLQSWQDNVARYAVGNSRLIIALSAAFAGPLIGPCSAESGGLHFRGASSTGKSTALHVGGSAWGGGEVNGFVRSWRATANGLEGVALARTDALLCLDELSQLAARDAGEAAYMLANGSGKSRSSRDGSARKPSKWRVLFLSSGEIGLADKIAEDGRARKLAAGQQVRIIDIPADAGEGLGLFETLHGFPSADVFARQLRTATQNHHGVAARQYLSAAVPDIEDIRKAVADIMRSFSELYVPAGADGQVERVAQRFALIAAGGEVATRVGILPWNSGVAIAAAGRVFADWLAMRGGIEPAEAREGIEQVRAFLLANGLARFVPAWDVDENRIAPRDVAGFRRKVGDGWDYYVTTTAWKEICAGHDARRLAATMEQKGLLEAESSTRRAKLVSVNGHGKIRLYHFPARILEGDLHD